jgi:hypothetical protein
MQGSTTVKPESIIKPEMIDQVIEEMCPRKNPIAPTYKMTEIGNGRTAIDLDYESDTVCLESSPGSIRAQASRGKTRDAGSLFVPDDEDDIYVVETRPAKKRKALNAISIVVNPK